MRVREARWACNIEQTRKTQKTAAGSRLQHQSNVLEEEVIALSVIQAMTSSTFRSFDRDVSYFNRHIFFKQKHLDDSIDLGMMAFCGFDLVYWFW